MGGAKRLRYQPVVGLDGLRSLMHSSTRDENYGES